MKILSLLLIIQLLCSGISRGEWDISGVFTGNYSETSLSGNWTGSESEARTWILQGNMSAVLDAEPSELRNSLKAEYGRTSSGGADEAISADLIYLESIYLYGISRYGSPYVSFSADTSFTDFFDPGVLTESAGLGFKILSRKNHTLKTRLGAAFRQIVKERSSFENETGMQSVTGYSAKLAGNLKFSSEMNIFTAFEGGADIRWDNSLYIQLHRYLTASAGYLAVYNYHGADEKPVFPGDIQTRLTFGIGVSFNLF